MSTTPGTLLLNAFSPPTTTGVNPVPQSAGSFPPWINSAYRIISLAMHDAGYLDKEQDPDSTDLAEYMPRLSYMVNEWQTEGLRLWLQEDLSFAVVGGQNLYQFGPTATGASGTYFLTAKPLRILEGYWQDLYGNRRPLDPCMSRNEWDIMSSVVQQGVVTSYFVDKQQNFLNLWLWLTPDDLQPTIGTVHVLNQIQINNPISVTDSMNFPFEWFNALHWGLADEISVGQPADIIAKCQQKAESSFDTLNNWDVEDASTKFQPDQRSQYYTNNFV